VELTWTDGSIAQEWLEVTVNADANTGLATPYTFFYGSLIGDVNASNTLTRAVVSSSDENAVRANNGIATVSNLYDVNKDASVNSSDEATARSHNTALTYIKIAGNAPLAPLVTPSATVALSGLTTTSAATTSAATASPASVAGAYATLGSQASTDGANPASTLPRSLILGTSLGSPSGARPAASGHASGDFWNIVDESLVELLATARRHQTPRKV
jgi:hypothetical protein